MFDLRRRTQWGTMQRMDSGDFKAIAIGSTFLLALFGAAYFAGIL